MTGLLELWMARVFVGDRLGRPADHTRLIISQRSFRGSPLEAPPWVTSHHTLPSLSAPSPTRPVDVPSFALAFLSRQDERRTPGPGVGDAGITMGRGAARAHRERF